MKKTAKITFGSVLTKIVVGIVVLVMLGSVLTACSSKSSKIEITTIKAVDGKNALTTDQLNKLATFIANSTDKKNDLTLREMLTAAYRGYDVSGGENPETDYSEAITEVVTEYKALSELETFSEADTTGTEADTDEAAEEATALVEVTRNVIDASAAVKAIDAFNTDKKNIEFDYSEMNARDVEDIILGLQTSLDVKTNLDFLSKILYYIGVALNWVTNTIGFGSYVVGLLIFSIVIEILMIPFSIKQQKNSIKQAKLRPKEKAIQKKYAGRNDQATKQKMNEEIQAMYQRENFSPASGCLPLLLQFPIIIALYYIVIDPLQYMLGQSTNLSTVFSRFYTTAISAGGMGGNVGSNRGTIEILSRINEKGIESFQSIRNFVYYTPGTVEDSYKAMEDVSTRIPDFTLGKLNFGLTPTFDFSTVQAWLLIIPVLTFIAYFFSMKITKKLSYQSITAQDAQMGCSGKIMDYMMPLMSVWICFMVPAAVGLYWIFKSLVGVAKSFIMAKAMPLPKFTEEDYKAAEREYAGKAPKASGTGGASSGNVRSLHHIDDDEYDYAPAPKRNKSIPYTEDDEPEQASDSDTEKNTDKTKENKKKGMISGADIKDYDRKEQNSDNENQN